MQYFPELLEALLKERGLNTKEDREHFLNPSYNKLHAPLLIPDMERARDRILEAIKNGEHVVVFSDYDADGIPGAVILSDFFKRIGYENVSFYIPHRHDEGFGLNMDAVEEIAGRGARVMITVDCGTADHEEVSRAQELGMDVIVTDHHEPARTTDIVQSGGQKSPPTGGLPKAYAVVNPKRNDSKYPFKEICGSVVVFKLVQAVYEKDRLGVKEGMEKWSLDMAGIATLSDMVPLVGENRIIAKYGLDVLRKSVRPGLLTLFRKLHMDQKNLTEDDVVFMITPRINAASRMGVPEDAFKLLSTTDQLEAEKLADHLEKINNERKGVVASLVKEAKAHIKDREKINDVIVIGNPEWRPALMGLVANSLVEEYARPAFVWGRDGDGVLKGSCRSFNGYNLYALMEKVSDTFIEFGGHAGAGGFSVTLENLTSLEEKLSKSLAHLEAQPPSSDNTALYVKLDEVGENLWQTISQFAPFGMGNDKPVLKLSNVPIKSVRTFGKENNHLEVILGDGVKAIAFFATPESYKLPLDMARGKQATSSHCTVLGHLEKSYFMNRPEIRLRIVDIIK